MANKLQDQRDFLGLLYGKPISQSQKFETSTYRRIWSEAYGDIPEGYEIHHIDGDPLNNKLCNLACLPMNFHRALHGRPLKHYAGPVTGMAPNYKGPKNRETLKIVPLVSGKKILTLKEACDLLKISEMTMRRWLGAAKIPAHRMGRQWRFFHSELIQWIRNDGNSQTQEKENKS